MNRDIRPARPGVGAGAASPGRSRNNYDDRRDYDRRDYDRKDYSASSDRYGSQARDQRRPNREPESDRYAGSGGSGRYGDSGGRTDQRRPMESNRRYGETLSTGSNTSTNSSSGSSLLDRMKAKSYDTSARTSFEDDYDTPTQSGGWARKPTSLRTQKHIEQDEDEPADDANSAGNTLWGRVVAAAGSLTINVSKAWDNGINLQDDGEETPPGGETRLTKVMKAYYIERARNPEDLPEWLFEEWERRPMASQRRAGRDPRDARDTRDARDARDARDYRDRDYRRDRNEAPSGRGRYNDDYEDEPPSRTQNRGALRDVYDKAAAQAPSSRLAPKNDRFETASDTNATPSKAVSRLRAMRDAKRGQNGPTSPANNGRFPDNTADYEVGRRSMEPASDVDQRQPRMGLPRRPGGGRY